MQRAPSCPICESAYTLYVQDVFGKRTRLFYPQYFCMDCRSFFHRSSYYETQEQKKEDFNFLLLQRENHAVIEAQLVLELVTKLPGTKTVLEIGHGTGFFLKACKDYKLEARGFEVNEYCHKFAIENLGVDSQLGLLDASHSSKYDLVVAVQVFEHIEYPRDLFKLMRDKLNPDGAIYLSVPFVERNQWKFLWTAHNDTTDRPAADVFFDNDVHITHFSISGMKKMGLGLGARSAEYFVSKDVFHNSPGAYQGVLFSF